MNKQKLVDTRFFYFILLCISAMTALGSIVIAPSLPYLEKHFNNVANIAYLSKLVLTIPAIFIVFFSPISGYLFDKYKRLNLLYPAMLIWGISGVSGFFLDNIYYILISRAIFGIANAFVMTGASALIADYYTGTKREKALIAKSLGYAFISAICVILGGFLAKISWRYPFLIYGIAFVIFLFAIFLLFEPKKSDMINKNIKDINFNFFTFLPIYTFSFLGIALFYIAPTQVPFVITNILQKSGDFIGYGLALIFICSASVSIFYTKIRQVLSLYSMYSLCFGTIGIGLCIIKIFQSYPMTLIALSAIGFGLGILLITNSIWLFSLTNQHNRAKAYGFLVSSVFIAQFSSPLLTQPIVGKFGLLNMFLVFGLISFFIATMFLIKSFIKK